MSVERNRSAAPVEKRAVEPQVVKIDEPRHSNWAARVLRVFGWRVIYTPPPSPKGVVVVYPHTSNWDFILGVLARSVLGLRMHWVGKHTLFRWPFEWFMRALGGVPVNRSQTKGLVEQLSKEFDRYPQFFLVLTPEGTRKRTEYWKSGFYHLAHGLDLPLGLAAFDYSKKEVVLTQWIKLTGNVEDDLARVRKIYKGTQGRHRECAGEIQFKE